MGVNMVVRTETEGEGEESLPSRAERIERLVSKLAVVHSLLPATQTGGVEEEDVEEVLQVLRLSAVPLREEEDTRGMISWSEPPQRRGMEASSSQAFALDSCGDTQVDGEMVEVSFSKSWTDTAAVVSDQLHPRTRAKTVAVAAVQSKDSQSSSSSSSSSAPSTVPTAASEGDAREPDLLHAFSSKQKKRQLGKGKAVDPHDRILHLDHKVPPVPLDVPVFMVTGLTPQVRGRSPQGPSSNPPSASASASDPKKKANSLSSAPNPFANPKSFTGASVPPPPSLSPSTSPSRRVSFRQTESSKSTAPPVRKEGDSQSPNAQQLQKKSAPALLSKQTLPSSPSPSPTPSPSVSRAQTPQPKHRQTTRTASPSPSPPPTASQKPAASPARPKPKPTAPSPPPNDESSLPYAKRPLRIPSSTSPPTHHSTKEQKQNQKQKELEEEEWQDEEESVISRQNHQRETSKSQKRGREKTTLNVQTRQIETISLSGAKSSSSFAPSPVVYSSTPLVFVPPSSLSQTEWASALTTLNGKGQESVSRQREKGGEVSPMSISPLVIDGCEALRRESDAAASKIESLEAENETSRNQGRQIESLKSEVAELRDVNTRLSKRLVVEAEGRMNANLRVRQEAARKEAAKAKEECERKEKLLETAKQRIDKLEAEAREQTKFLHRGKLEAEPREACGSAPRIVLPPGEETRHGDHGPRHTVWVPNGPTDSREGMHAGAPTSQPAPPVYVTEPVQNFPSHPRPRHPYQGAILEPAKAVQSSWQSPTPPTSPPPAPRVPPSNRPPASERSGGRQALDTINGCGERSETPSRGLFRPASLHQEREREMQNPIVMETDFETATHRVESPQGIGSSPSPVAFRENPANLQVQYQEQQQQRGVGTVNHSLHPSGGRLRSLRETAVTDNGSRSSPTPFYQEERERSQVHHTAHDIRQTSLSTSGYADAGRPNAMQSGQRSLSSSGVAGGQSQNGGRLGGGRMGTSEGLPQSFAHLFPPSNLGEGNTATSQGRPAMGTASEGVSHFQHNNGATGAPLAVSAPPQTTVTPVGGSFSSQQLLSVRKGSLDPRFFSDRERPKPSVLGLSGVTRRSSGITTAQGLPIT
uniref:Uncharacterized protein n=1 Tax=Chromera velia CCMP2878 TaxID=1169474 RepID=A0A0G4FRZ6_9ALVE|eukprot:Cvel_18469.t1-p1 / transcript=Cvel_18469.t1 / gene=Cvel_18469 / organism=Chromera_velia_CCMP2878 / gene_product=hypothetical protein / transcript_product=hypothetical protein / location=Cvel_scaffold1531:7143-13993(+) / protein_length=1099 / sequence_SO=supercontig / SO=protein_coding / is_pseudo=false